MEKLTLLTLAYDDYVDILDLFMTQFICIVNIVVMILFAATINQ